MVSRRRSSTLLAAAALCALAVGCGKEEADLENGKRLYTGQLAEGQKGPDGYQPCGACHALARANTSGAAGPDLDEAFATARRDGMNKKTVQGVVEDQIAHPRRNSTMPADLVTGDDARDVAAYVAEVAGQPGEDRGQLATIGKPVSNKPIAAKDGVLTMPADETGALAFASTRATAEPGPLEVVMPNPSPIQHNIAFKGGPIGPVVGTGGRSVFETTVTAKTYEYYCSVPGHEEGGMKGTLTVE
jgi:mono/diheme cytochrome c family protein